MRSYSSLSTAKNLLRLLELCLAVAALAWATNRLPSAIRISGDFLRRLSSVISSHLFVFLLSNSIIAALFFTAARFSGGSGGNAGELTESYCLTSTETSLSPPPPTTKSPFLAKNEAGGNNYGTSNANGEGEEIVYEDKEMISSSEVNVECDSDSESDLDSCSNFDGVRVYRRTKSEKVKKIPKKKELRRAETAEKMRSAAEEEEEKEMSSEEFQRAVEEFIEKHLKFRRQESLSLVVQNQRDIEAK